MGWNFLPSNAIAVQRIYRTTACGVFAARFNSRDARKAESEQALQTVLKLVQEFGFTAQQVFPWKPQPKKVAAKYRDPATGATWSGRGKPPQWIAGKDRTPFVIV